MPKVVVTWSMILPFLRIAETARYSVGDSGDQSAGFANSDLLQLLRLLHRARRSTSTARCRLLLSVFVEQRRLQGHSRERTMIHLPPACESILWLKSLVAVRRRDENSPMRYVRGSVTRMRTCL